jgi:hypothetical protein
VPAVQYSGVIEQWLTTEAQRLRISCVRVSRSTDPISKFVAEYEGVGFLLSVEAWDEIRCVDVTVMEMNSGKSQSLGWGECQTINDVRARLDRLAAWIGSRAVA